MSTVNSLASDIASFLTFRTNPSRRHVSIWHAMLATACNGITGGNISIANAYLADLSSDGTRSKNFGKMAISSNLGFILGPALAGILGGNIYGAILPVLAALILSLVTLIVIGFLLRESKPSS